MGRRPVHPPRPFRVPPLHDRVSGVVSPDAKRATLRVALSNSVALRKKGTNLCSWAGDLHEEGHPRGCPSVALGPRSELQRAAQHGVVVGRIAAGVRRMRVAEFVREGHVDFRRHGIADTQLGQT